MYYRTFMLACFLPAIAILTACSGGGREVSTAEVDLSQLPPQEAVHVMAAKGDLDGLKAALQQNPQLANARSIRNRNLLHTAAEAGQKNVVSYLLEMGLNPNEPDDQGAYPNELAAAEGHDDIARLLSNAPAN